MQCAVENYKEQKMGNAETWQRYMLLVLIYCDGMGHLLPPVVNLAFAFLLLLAIKKNTKKDTKPSQY